jgi:hypothetical protein
MGVDVQRQNPAALPAGKKPGTHLHEAGWKPQDRSGRVWKISLPPTFVPRTVQSLCRLSNPGVQCGDKYVETKVKVSPCKPRWHNREWKYRSILFLMLKLDRSVVSFKHRPLYSRRESAVHKSWREIRVKTSAGVDDDLVGNRTTVRRLSSPWPSHHADWKTLPQIECWLSSSKYISLFFYRRDIWGQ